MSGDERVPVSLRERIATDLWPVRPLAEPWKRALVLAPLGVLLLAWLNGAWGLRSDANVLGGVLVWGLSLAQLALAALLAALALRDVVPGRETTAARLGLFGALAFAALVAVTWLTWHRSPTTVPALQQLLYWSVCVIIPTLLGLPILAVLLWLASRGVWLRPVRIGAFAGLAAGLVVDSGWRTFCAVSAPGHVFGSHYVAVALLGVVGALAGKLWSAVAERRAASPAPARRGDAR